MASPSSNPRSRTKRRFERYQVVLTVLVAGWVPSVLMLLISYTTLRNTLEEGILRDRQTFVQLVAHLIDDDLARTSSVVSYYQTLPDMERILTAPNPEAVAQQWVGQRLFAYPRIDGLFLADAKGNLLAALPARSAGGPQNIHPDLWRDQANTAQTAFVTQVHSRGADGRPATNIVGAIRTLDGRVLGYLGATVLVERMGRRLASITFANQAECQIIDQNGHPLFGSGFSSDAQPVSPSDARLVASMLKQRTGHVTQGGTIYSFEPMASAKWLAVVHQPEEVAYAPVRELLRKITLPAGFLIVGTALAAWLAGGFYRRQDEARQRIEREVTFNEKILANMPIGIALIDPATKKFLHLNDAFAQMATQIGQLPAGTDLAHATYEKVQIAPATAVPHVLETGAPFQLVEQPFRDRTGTLRFLNVNLLRLQDAQQNIQGVLYLVEEKTRDMTLRNELLGANAAKDQFLALLSHELRNPLSPVIAMVQELEETVPETPSVRHALDVIRRNVELEARLIDDLLDVTRISKGKLKLRLEPVSVHTVLQRALEICRDDIANKSLEVDIALEAAEHFVQGDPARLQQIFWNLIKNSVKFTPARGRIRVETSNPQPGEVEVRTIDSGIGITADKIGKIFNAFEQGQSSITRRFGGLGLGLAISRAMVQAHGGTITATSSGQDTGATFAVRLDTIAEPTPAAGLANGGATPAARRPTDRKPHLLVVDDHRDTCQGMKTILERRGYDITLAYDADQAAKKAEAESFDLVISDIGLPGRSGYELMEQLRGRGLRGIALSGFGMDQDISRAHAAGFSEHLTKPINFERLEEAIQHLLAENGTPSA